MGIKEVRFNQLYRLHLGSKNLSSYLILRNRVIDWEPYNAKDFYYIERSDLAETPKRTYPQAVDKAIFKKFWMHDMVEVTSVKEKTIVSLRSGLSER